MTVWVILEGLREAPSWLGGELEKFQMFPGQSCWHVGVLGQKTKTSHFLENFFKGSQVTLVCPKHVGFCFCTSLEQLPIHAAPVGDAHRRSRGIAPF